MDTLGVQLDFSIPKDNAYIKFFIDCGDKILLCKNGKTLFQGIITDKNINGIFEESFTAFDFAFYLNKSKVIKQFNNINGRIAISSICSEQGINVGEIPTLNTNINHIYFENTIAEIIDDILQQCSKETGKIYYKEVLKDKLYIFERGTKIINPTYKMAVNVASIKVLDEIGQNFSKGYSIANLKNKVTIITQNEKEARVIATKEDNKNIEKYGLLHHIESVDQKDKNQATNIANNRLKELNKIKETLSLELLGDITIKAGRVLNINNKEININGKFNIISSNHTIESGIHKTNIELERL
ncbi:XkdQ/YqbQ family protein [[Clostridium] colinum]